ncbi:ribosomal protein L7Ae-like RNA K-turn-binding protein [Caldicoprobacter guelmensis]|uniref:L7Ae/L30e/S12e/Gadd45 family ribosomal protein n=1 Tax=Caldicoprobacter guelmensis TaxID=1170224 RepID=UPI001957FF6F|nr:ribosomal L7Ae/L30e/S12e/Gadd45 family protein [Caldicoprobacter guelmensis]MBM7581425.1 ribosomal protein L7Ae-like RNA K-turn-binding protein [Caldicoprobacter guelmensis]
MNHDLKNFYQLLGLATRAGKLITGEEMCLKAIRTRKAKLVVISEEASPNTLKKFTDKCRYYNVDYVIIGSKEMLGMAVGKGSRTVLAVTDEGLKESLLKKLQNSEMPVRG